MVTGQCFIGINYKPIKDWLSLVFCCVIVVQGMILVATGFVQSGSVVYFRNKKATFIIFVPQIMITFLII